MVSKRKIIDSKPQHAIIFADRVRLQCVNEAELKLGKAMKHVGRKRNR